MSFTTSILLRSPCRCLCFQGLTRVLPLSPPGTTLRRGICNVRAGISTSVSDSLKEAMKSKDASRVRALRGIRAAFMVAMKEDGADELKDEQAIAQLRRLAKMRHESIEMFEKGGRQDLALAEREELLVIEAYLPALADEAQTLAWAEEAKAATGAQSKKEFGKVMGAVMKSHRQEVDGALLKKVVTQILQ